MLVNPIKNVKDIKAIKTILFNKQRDLFIFTLGINCGLRVGDLCKLKVSQFLNKNVGDIINIIERKTGKANFITINKEIYKNFRNYYDSTTLNDNDFIFKSREGKSHLHPYSVCRLIKKWCNDINLKGNYGNHTLRKTFGYQHRVNNNVGIEVLMKRFNHSSQYITQKYIGVDEDEIIDVCMKTI